MQDTAAQSEVNTANLRIQVEARLSELSRALLDLNSKVESSIQKQNLLEQTVIDRLAYILNPCVIYRGSQQTIADRPTDQQTNGELIEFR